MICERTQSWSLIDLQNAVTKLLNNPRVPIGFIYIQLPRENSPVETWPWVEWEDVSSEYEILFFRTEGGNAAPFGEMQEEDSPRSIPIRIMKAGEYFDEISIEPNNEFSPTLKYRWLQCITIYDLQV